MNKLRSAKKISIVVPCHNEQQNVVSLYEALLPVFRYLNSNFELIFVDDSSDNTADLIRTIHKEDKRIKLIKLTRSFGQSAAIFAGLQMADGDAVIVMDSDLEDPPEAIPLMIKQWSEGFDVVLARRKRSGLKLTYRLFQALYYRLSRTFSEIDIPEGVGEFRLLDRRVVKTISKFEERVKFFRGLSLWPGFRRTIIDIERNARVSGKSQYNFFRATSVAVDGLVSFSAIPLRLISLSGLALSTGAALLTAGYLVWRILDADAFGPGWASIFLFLVFSTGLNLLFLGVVAEYVGRIFQQMQGRPAYLVDYTLTEAPGE